MTPSSRTYLYAGGGLLLLGGGWAAYRVQQRRKLVDLLAASPRVAQAKAEGVITWTPEAKAAEEITFTGTGSAEAAFARILNRLEKFLAPEDEGQSFFEEVEEEGITSALMGKASEMVHAGWTWATTNPQEDLTWAEFLEQR